MIDARLWQVAGWTMLHYFWIGALLGAVSLFVRWQLRTLAVTVRYAVALSSFLLLCAAPAGIAVWVLQHTPESEVAVLPNTATAIEQQTIGEGVESPTGIPMPRLHQSPVPSPQPAPSATPQPMQPVAAVAAQPVEKPLFAAFDPIVARLPWLWVLGSPLTFVLTAVGLLGAERLRRSSTPLKDDRISAMCRQLAATLKLSRRVGCGGLRSHHFADLAWHRPPDDFAAHRRAGRLEPGAA